jgi:two-component system NtrC family sensor kinase
MLLNHKEDVHNTIRSIAATPAVGAIRIYDKQGAVIFSADPAEIGGQADLHAEACVSCHTGPTPLQSVPVGERSRVFARHDGERLLGLISPIPNAPDCSTAACHAHPSEQSVLGVLDVTMSLAAADAQLARLEANSVAAAALMALIAGTLSAVFVWRVVRRPVKGLIHGARRVAAGDLETEIPVVDHSEMSDLARAFNAMTQDLARARAELTQWSDRLEANLQDKTAELSRTQRQVAHMDKMASLGRLAATVAHELNNPMAGILNYAKLVERTLREGSLPDEERAELTRYLGLIQREAARSGDIVRNLLSFARQTGGAFAPHALTPILDRALMLVNHSLQMSQVRLDLERTEEDDRLECDADQIQQALVALLVNAAEAMPQGGTLRVRTEGDPDELRLTLADSGCGIAAESLPRIFEPFFTSKDETGGAGLGLAVVYGIVQRHNGEIDVESVPGRGTTFRIRLPRTQPEGAGAAPSPELLASHARRS